MMLDGAVSGQPRVDRLVAAVHRYQVDVHVDKQVAVGDALVDPDFLILLRLAEQDVALRILGIVVVKPVREETLKDARADPFFDLVRRHPAMQANGADEVNVLAHRRRRSGRAISR